MTRIDCALLLLLAVQGVTLPAGAASSGIPDGELGTDPDARGIAEMLFTQGRLAWADADAETALARFERAASIWPKDATYSYFAGHAELRLRRPDRAAARISRALPPARSRIPEWRIRSDLGMAHYMNGDAEAAGRYLREARQLAPDDAATLFYLGLVLLDLARPAEAAGMFEEARERAPELSADSYYYAGVAALRCGDFESARQDFQRALDDSFRVRHSIPEIRADARKYLEILERLSLLRGSGLVRWRRGPSAWQGVAESQQIALGADADDPEAEPVDIEPAIEEDLVARTRPVPALARRRPGARRHEDYGPDSMAVSFAVCEWPD